MAAPLLKGPALVRQRLLGVVFLAVILSLVWLTTQLYQQRFTPVARVLLQADSAGNQLTQGADVKVRGLIVGRVSSVSSTGHGAQLQLAIDADKAPMIPTNVSAQLLPKTLFGEKFVSLVLPAQPSGAHLASGDVIPQDRSSTALETEKVLDDLLPLLQTLKPAQLNYTLHAVSTALQGRGDAIGQNLVATDRYFAQLNPRMPQIAHDIRGLAKLSEDYNAATPDLLGFLDNISAVNRNLSSERTQLAAFLQATTGSTSDLDRFLSTNQQRLVSLASDSTSSLAVYARYSPEYPCLANGLVRADGAIRDSFGVLQPGLHIKLEVTKDNGPYVQGDQPKYGDDAGPTCFGLTGKPVIPFPFYRNGIDGYRDGQPVNPKTGQFGSGSGSPAATGASTSASPVDFARALGYSDRAMTKAVLGAALDRPSSAVPDIAVMLFGPVARGTTVALS